MSDIMRIAELMERQVKAVDADSTVAEAVVTLADSHISALPVLDGHGRMVGVLSSTDLLVAEAETDPDGEGVATSLDALFARTRVRELMTRQPITIAPDADVRDAARQMLYADVHRLFVTEGDQLVGVISTTDIVRAVANGHV